MTIQCQLCDDTGWVCENHPEIPWLGERAFPSTVNMIVEHASQPAVAGVFFQKALRDQGQHMAVPKQRRSSARKMRSHGERITLEGDLRSYECQVADISADGAKLLSAADVIVGSQLKLSASEHAMVSRPSEVMWRRGRQIGVKFVK
jgi:hypothetical protein